MTREFTTQVEGFERRVRSLIESCRTAKEQEGGLLLGHVLEELSTSLEELKVAEEELAAQNFELEAAQTQAESERRRYRDLFFSAPQGYLITNQRGTILEANHAATDLLGAPSGYLTGKPMPLLVVNEDRADFQRWLRGIQAGELGVAARVEARVQTVSRTRTFPCKFSFWRTSEDGEDRSALRWAIEDLTLRDRALERDWFEEQAQRKDEFLAVLAHELRNPLAAISLAAELLGREVNPAEGRAFWATELVRRHSLQLTRLVNELLDVSRVYHGKVELSRMAMELSLVVDNAVETVQPMFRQRHQLLAIDRDASPLWVNGDAVRLQQVMVNLLDNAARYTPEGGRIEVELRRSEERAVVTVRDFGIGIAPEAIDHIFGLFEQGGATTSPGGLGIGLTLVRELVRLHGGTIEARSEGKDRGSEFIMHLPIVEEPVRRQEPAVKVRLGNRDGAARVLIVDDNRDAADLVGLCLEDMGHQVSIAYSAARAQELVAGCTVALVDLAMPDLDGFQLAPLLRVAEPRVMLVALSGFGDDRSRAAAEKAGFEDYMMKPVDTAALDIFLRAVVAARG